MLTGGLARGPSACPVPLVSEESAGTSREKEAFGGGSASVLGAPGPPVCLSCQPLDSGPCCIMPVGATESHVNGSLGSVRA